MVWSHQRGGDWQCEAGASTIIATCEYRSAPEFFRSGFFADDVTFMPGHDQTLDSMLAASSPAVNAGDPHNQPARAQGKLRADGFIEPEGTPRDEAHHSAGPYELR